MEQPLGLGPARRVLVYGVTGSGKSTLAQEIGAITGLTYHALDDLTWGPDWVPVQLEEQRGRVESICKQPAWVIDAAYGSWLDLVLPRVELVVALDYPRWFSLQRLVHRCLARSIDKRPICNGNHETLRTAFLHRDSILWWHFTSFSRKRARIAAWAADPDAPRALRFRRARECDAWAADLRTVATEPQRGVQPEQYEEGTCPRF